MAKSFIIGKLTTPDDTDHVVKMVEHSGITCETLLPKESNIKTIAAKISGEIKAGAIWISYDPSANRINPANADMLAHYLISVVNAFYMKDQKHV